MPLQLSSMEDQRNLTFRYTAICFNEYEQVRYRYRFEGLESEWNPPTKNLEARYSLALRVLQLRHLQDPIFP